MKTLAIIFAFYFIGLNGLPCSDDFLPLQTQSQTESFISLDTYQGESHADQCSPFCQCHCCHIPVTELNTLYFESIVQPEIAVHNFIYTFNDGVNPIKRFFEPPRV